MAKQEKIKLTTPAFIAAFPSAFEAREGLDGGAAKFGVTAIWRPADFTDKDKRLWKEILAAVDAECQRVFKMDWATCKTEIEGFKAGLRDGKAKALDGFGPGTRFASLSSKFAPGVIDLRKEEISEKEGNADQLYAGALCRATIGVYAYSNKGKGVALGLNNLQVIVSDEAKYPRLDGRGNAGDDFDNDLDGDYLDQAEEPADDIDF